MPKIVCQAESLGARASGWNGQPLRSKPVEVSDSRLRMLARRAGGELVFTINDTETIRFEDPFPLPVSQPGVFGVYWPQDVHVSRMPGSTTPPCSSHTRLERMG